MRAVGGAAGCRSAVGGGGLGTGAARWRSERGRGAALRCWRRRGGEMEVPTRKGLGFQRGSREIDLSRRIALTRALVKLGQSNYMGRLGPILYLPRYNDGSCDGFL
jgi:hypothetical protein